MRIAIIGAGIVGVSTAYELAARGHEVTVFERHGGVASDASFAHGGLLHPGWPAAQAPLGWSLRQLAWHWAAWRAGKHPAAAERALQLQRLAQLSQGRLQQWRQELRLDYERADGVVLLLRSAGELKAAKEQASMLEALAIKHAWLEPADCLRLEPGLCPDTPLHGGLHLPQAEVGNGRQLAHLLKTEAQRLGARFRFHTTVRSVEGGSGPRLVHEYTPPTDATSVHRGEEGRGDSSTGPDTVPMPLEPQHEGFDGVVLCSALGAAPLLAALGMKLAWAPVHGHSITAALRQLEAHPDLGPRAGLIDLAQRTALSRQGQRVRVSGATRWGTTPGQPEPAALQQLHRVLHDWFPGAAQMSSVQTWSGTYPLLPDGLPLLGPMPQAGIWLNLGHGASGWSLAGGCAQVLGEAIAGQAPSLDIGPFGLSRLG